MREKKWLYTPVSLVLLVVMLLTVSIPVGAYAADAQWQLREDSRLLWVKTDDSSREDGDLEKQIQLFDSELAAEGLSASVLPIIYGESSDAKDGDILLVLDASLNIAEQGYEVDVDTDRITVRASDADGLFYGCRYVEQAMLQKSGLAVGETYSEKPDCPERGFFLDCGRKYYSPEWIKDMIREISWSNMNVIYLHFSEEMGFRLESKTYPWLAGADNTLCVNGSASGAAADNDKYITQDEMREIAETAKLYHVEIIPSLDSPGHMNYAVKKYMEQYGEDIGNYFHYNGKTSIVQGSGPESAQKSYSRGIDISNENAIIFAQNLYREYAAFFRELGCTRFDIGGDELLGWGTAVISSVSKWKQLDHWKAYAQNRAKEEGNADYADAVAYDAFMYYMNDIYEIVSSYGYTSVRMWNDDALRTYDTGYQNVVTLNPSVEIQYWTPAANSSKNNVWTYLKQGYKIYNFLNSYSYYVLGNEHTETGSGSYEGCTPQRIYENWNPYIFAPYGDTNTGKNTSIGNQNIKGSAFCVWCDNPSAETASEVKEGVLPLLRSHGAKAWNSTVNASVSYSDFLNRVSQIGNSPADLPVPSDIEEASKYDLTALKAALEEFDAVNHELYTEETYGAYRLASEAGRALLQDTSAITAQAQIDAAVDDMVEAKNRLRSLDAVSENEYLYRVYAKAQRIVRGKYAVLSVITTEDIVGFEIYDDNGKYIDILTITEATPLAKYPDEFSTYVKFQVTGAKGNRTYTIYGIDKEGKRSADSLQITLVCR
ncbi:MAG: family 20 glycosylhydrolase [Clostridiales bacterium]|nr:family 20 glycosylhydrolase [Clostridiales bacterium]